MKIVKKAGTVLLSFSTLMSLTGCATMMQGTKQSVGIASNPSNACIWVDKAYAGNTPMIVELSRKDNHVVKIELDGYQPYEAIFKETQRLGFWKHYFWRCHWISCGCHFWWTLHVNTRTNSGGNALRPDDIF